ncbi:MAG: tricarboxylate transporter [Paracoccus sp. (in: a-proteobacteria)]|nr:tricarboxylate transporter [Paracoccus sp. (in: a-proteobacteria)]
MSSQATRRQVVRAGLGLLGAAAVTSAPLRAGAGSRHDFAGQEIRWILPFMPGGGSDIWARFNAPFLERHLAGHPTVSVVTEPGGGSTRGANLYAQTARPDGLSVFGTSGSTQFPWLLGDQRVRYDYRDWLALMVAPTGGVVSVVPGLGVESWRDVARLAGQRLVFASQGPTSLDLVPMLAFRVLGLDVRYVFGFTGRGPGLAAAARGEASIDYQTTASFLRNVAPMVAEGRMIPVMSWGVVDAQGRVVRDPTFPELPTVEEVHQTLHGRPPEGRDYDAYRIFATAGFGAQKMMVLPRETPPEIIATWREGWAAVFADPEYQASVSDVLGRYEQVSGDAALALYDMATRIDPGLRSYVLELLASEYAVRVGD